jgi:hypothetical protein
MKTDNIIKLDLWGGHQTYNIQDKTYSINRNCGVFSNITISMYAILKLYSDNFDVYNIELILNEYIDDITNIHSQLFNSPNISNLKLKEYSESDINYSLRYGEASYLGLGRDQTHLILDLYNNIFNTYFNYNQHIHDIANNIILKNNISYDNSVFIWARGTDKITETSIPKIEKYLKILKDKNLLKHNIFVQTDDAGIAQNFKDYNISNLHILYEIPFSNSDKGFHNNLNNISDHLFLETYNIDKITYIKTLLALTIIASRCKYYISYPGNLSTVIPIIKNTFNNCFCFKNDTDLL